jgi:flagellar motor protein MotB
MHEQIVIPLHTPNGGLNMLKLTALFLVVAPTLALGCRTPEPWSPDHGLSQVRPPQPPDLGRGAARIEYDLYGTFVNDEVRNACSGPAPFFSTASANPTSRDHATMGVLATCMISGALREKSVLLVGRTDPRGSDAYNDKLGLARADHVKAYLVSRGVDETRVLTASLGKEDASASSASWPSDRRVEIRLVN